MIGKILGNRYEILEKIGTGGMGNVYKAHCKKLDRIVAIKILKLEYNEDNNFIRKFKRESHSAASISHPNIVSIYDVGSETIDGELVHYIVMEYIDGKTLKEIILDEGKLSVQKSLNYAMQIAEALKIAHSKHIVHRDIKSQNIMVTSDDRVKVTDFGIARVADNTTVTATNAVMGSVHYFSPEQAKGSKVDNRSDIYSLGIVLYEMLTGSLPFDADNPVSVALMQVQSNMPNPSDKVRSIPKEVDELVHNMTLKDPDKRYPDVFELIRDIKSVRSGRKTHFTEPVRYQSSGMSDTYEPVKPKVRKKKKKKKKSVAPAILGMLSAIFIIALLIYIAPKALGTMNKKPVVEKIKMPQLVGMNKDDAEKKLEEFDISLNIVETKTQEDKLNDEILEQDPIEDTEVEKGSSVDVVINKLPDSEKVPSLLGKTLEAAQAELENMTLEIGKIEHEFSEDVAEGRIIKQFPDPNTEVAKNSNISITVSKGEDKRPINMSSYKGLDAQAAKKTLENLGFKVELKEGFSDAVGVGQVFEQSIKPGSEAFKGDLVTLSVSKGPDTSNIIEPVEDEENQEEEETEPEIPTKNVTVKTPNDEQRHKVIAKRVVDSKGNKTDRVVFNWNKDPGENVDVELIGKGEYEIYVDDELVKNVSIK